ncbi:hypothetical protein ACFQ0B_69180 [Nonomuraea thailandensis]
MGRDEVSAADVTGLRDRAPEIVEAVARLLDTVRAADPNAPAGAGSATSVRASWL